MPTRAAVQRMRIEHLVELPRRRIDHDHVPVAGAIRAALDRRIRRNRVGARVALIVVVERHRNFRLGPAHEDVRDAVRRAIPDRAEVRVHLAGRPTAAVDERRRVGVHRLRGDVHVPRIIGREDGSRSGRAATARAPPPVPPPPFLASATSVSAPGARVESPAQAMPNVRRPPSTAMATSRRIAMLHSRVGARGLPTITVVLGPRGGLCRTTSQRSKSCARRESDHDAGARPIVGRCVRLRDARGTRPFRPVSRNALCTLWLRQL